MFKKDNLPLGIFLGLFTPVIGFILYYLLVFLPKHIGPGEFVDVLLSNRHMIPKVIGLCVALNGAVFYLYTEKRRDITAKGIFLVTMLYVIAILLLMAKYR